MFEFGTLSYKNNILVKQLKEQYQNNILIKQLKEPLSKYFYYNITQNNICILYVLERRGLIKYFFI